MPTRHPSPIASSNEMMTLFSQRSRCSTWRKLRLGLAEAEVELGIDIITPEALDQMRAHLTITDADFEASRVEEKIRRHDVMAHVRAFGLVAPAAAGVIHYGATSCYVTDNAELILKRDALDILINKVAKVIANLRDFSLQWKGGNLFSLPTLLFKQTSGDIVDFHALQLSPRWPTPICRALRTTGTQASFLEIFQGDHAKCDALNEKLCKRFGFPACYIIMKLVAKGASRQEAHEEIRVLSHQAASVVKNDGKPNDLIERIRNTEYFKPIWGDLDSMMQPELYVGRSIQIVEKYCGPGGAMEKALAPYQQHIAGSATVQLNVWTGWQLLQQVAIRL
ncbi:hypothetical protein ACJZ2D_016177 [Fusarium nematophilum]